MIKPKDINRVWKPVMTALKKCLPDQEYMAPTAYQSLHQGLVDGSLQCWIAANEEKKASLLAVTSKYTDKYTGTSGLLVYALYALRETKYDVMEELKKSMQEYAYRSGCLNVVLLNTLGGDSG